MKKSSWCPSNEAAGGEGEEVVCRLEFVSLNGLCLKHKHLKQGGVVTAPNTAAPGLLTGSWEAYQMLPVYSYSLFTIQKCLRFSNSGKNSS